jgi:hypothetical protein
MERVVRTIVIALVLIAAAAAVFIFAGNRPSTDQSVATRVGDRIKNAATTVIVKEIENPECARLLQNIKGKTAALVQKISPSGHEILLAHAGTKSTISLDCSTPSKMSMTFISKDTSPTDDWFTVIGASSDLLVNRDPSLIIAEARKCLSAAKKDPTTSAQEEISGFDVDCALPEGDESGYLVAVMAADPAAQIAPAKPLAQTTPRKTGGIHHK